MHSFHHTHRKPNQSVCTYARRCGQCSRYHQITHTYTHSLSPSFSLSLTHTQTHSLTHTHTHTHRSPHPHPSPKKTVRKRLFHAVFSSHEHHTHCKPNIVFALTHTGVVSVVGVTRSQTRLSAWNEVAHGPILGVQGVALWTLADIGTLRVAASFTAATIPVPTLIDVWRKRDGRFSTIMSNIRNSAPSSSLVNMSDRAIFSTYNMLFNSFRGKCCSHFRHGST